jgi:ribosomal protein S7
MPMIPSTIFSLGDAFRSRAPADEWTTVASEAAAAAVAVEIRKSRREGLSGRFITKAPNEGVGI